MNIKFSSLRRETRLAVELAALYKSKGYREYRMRTFEEYSLYLDNKDFLMSPEVVTFGSTDGKLLALRPDVTLSVIKNARAEAGRTEKLFYHENVYRVSPESGDFKEIGQIGVEVVGDAGEAEEAEVALLVCKTLAAVSDRYLVDVSHMGFVSGLIDTFGGTEFDRAEAYECLRKKNVHDFGALAERLNLTEGQISAFRFAAGTADDWRGALREAERLALTPVMAGAARDLGKLFGIMERLGYADRMHVNFSIANDSGYYNGVVFGGYIEGVPHAVLTGGRYDKLLAKFRKKARAVGFALYLGDLERYFPEEPDVTDVLLLAEEKDAAEALAESERLNAQGLSVRVAREIPADARFGEVRRQGGEKQ